MTLSELAALVGGQVAPDATKHEISGLASLDDAGPGDLSFYGNPKYLRALRKSRATAVLVPQDFREEIPAVPVRVADPAAAFSVVLARFVPPAVTYPPGIHPTAIIAGDASLGDNVSVGPHVVIETGASIGPGTIIGANSYIGHAAKIGASCHIFPNVTVRERCLLGDHCILHPGVVIGADGFGYELRDGRHQKIPQTGIVEIEDDVEIGANSTIDRARFGRTWIRRGTKIDNLVQIGHNVTIGEHTILCAQVGISGSTRVGNFVTLAGKVGVNGHIEIGDGVIATAMSGISRSAPAKEILIGIPARPAKSFKTAHALLYKLEGLFARVKALESKTSQAP